MVGGIGGADECFPKFDWDNNSTPFYHEIGTPVTAYHVTLTHQGQLRHQAKDDTNLAEAKISLSIKKRGAIQKLTR